MNIMQMMKQAQNLKKRIKDTQEELAAQEVIGEAGNGSVSVVFDGQGQFKSIKIKPEAINSENPSSVDADSVEILEDLITTAIKQASDKASNLLNQKMSAVTGGINIPGLF